jgi:hypothetical protein
MPVEAKFMSPLDTRKIGDRRWLLIDDLVYQTAILGSILVVPRGFQTDFASIPSYVGSLFPIVGAYDPAAVVHDAGYGGAVTTQDGQRINLIKEWSDRLFHEAMLACGVSPMRAWIMYRAVAAFGDPSRHPLAAHASSTGGRIKA